MKTYIEVLPEFLVTALIYGDLSGLNEEEEVMVKEIETLHKGSPIDCSNEPYFGRYKGMGCNLLEYTFVQNN